jgi:hypothetical protein
MRMDNIRCPMCGKENPGDLNVCQYCQARLKPLTGPLADASAQPGEGDDWLGSLRSEGDLAGDEESDWHDDDGVERLGDEFRDPLERLSALSSTGFSSTPPEKREVKEPEQDYQPEGEPAEDHFDEEFGSEKVDLSAWLASLDEAEPEAEKAAGAVKGELPDWLQEHKERTALPEPDEGDDTPEWLAGLKAGTGGFDTAEEAVPSEPERFEYPEDTARAEEELPDWLRMPGDEGVAEEPPVTTPAESEDVLPAEKAELPDWLAELGVDEPALEPAADFDLSEEGPAAEMLVGDADHVEEPGFPAWQADGGQDFEQMPEGEAAEATGLPQWLMEAAGVESGGIPQAEGEDSEQFPEWLSILEEPESPDMTGEPPLEAGDLPDWLRESQPPELGEFGIESTEQASEPEFQALDFAGIGGSLTEDFPGPAGDEIAQAADLEAVEIPDWLADLQPAEEQAGEVVEIPNLDAMAFAPVADNADDWLSALASDVSSEAVEEKEEADRSALAAAAAAAALAPFAMDSDTGDEVEDIFLGQEPDWLADVAKESATEKAEGVEDDEILRADLPEWLAAMRPVDAVMAPKTPAEESTGEMESAGPLAGLADVLPAEAGIFQLTKPDSLSVRLDVNEAQQRHVVLLEQMLKQETKIAPAATAKQAVSERLIRWIVFAVLFLSAAVSIFRGVSGANLPVPGPEAQAVYSAINALPAQAPVLVAFDYEPGLSGEMETISTALLDHLMLRGVLITLVSTTPTGPIQAENIIYSLSSRYTYERDSQYVNLGYIPGGPTGLQTLANFPMRFLLPYTFSGYEAWDPRLLPLANVEQFTDYAMILVLTDRQETGRAWIEQIGPRSGSVAFVFGASAQIEPLIRPYYGGDANFVDGFVAGLAGSGAYESLAGQPGWGSQYWGTYEFLVLIASALILVGGLVTLLLSLPGKKQSNAKSEQTNEHA